MPKPPIPAPVPIAGNGDPCPRLSADFTNDVLDAIADLGPHDMTTDELVEVLAKAYGFNRDRLCEFFEVSGRCGRTLELPL